MIQLTDTLFWDESLTYDEQSNEVKSFVQNVINTYNTTTTKQPISNSHFNRKLSATYEGATFRIVEDFKYKNDVKNAGWLELKSYKITCYAK